MPVVVLLAVLVVALAGADGQWWQDVYYGRPLPLDVFAIAQPFLPLIEAYGTNRWSYMPTYCGTPNQACIVLVRWGQS